MIAFPLATAHAEASYNPYYLNGTSTPDKPPARTTSAPEASKQDWNVTLGLGAAIAPKYPGSSADHLEPIPMVSIIYQDTYFFGPNGLGANVLNWNGLKAGPVLGFTPERNHHDDQRLNKMGNIESSVNAGGFVSYTTGAFDINSVVKQAVTHMDSYGLSGSVAANYHLPLVPKKLDLSAGPLIDFADSDYMRTWFGVTQGQASASGFRAYSPQGGIEDIGASAMLTYHYTQHILLNTFLNVKELVGDAADSPITESATQVTGGVSIGYHF